MNSINLVIGGGMAAGPALAGLYCSILPAPIRCCWRQGLRTAVTDFDCGGVGRRQRLSQREDRVKRKTGFFFDERCFWHSTGLHAVTLPVGGWVQPPAGGGHAESPETKRRMKNLMDVSG